VGVSKSRAAGKSIGSSSLRPTDWSNVADWYDRLVGDAGSEYHQKVVLPGVQRLLDVKPAQRVLDLACGQGVLCRLLAGRGAEVTGVDSAAPLLEKARLIGKSIDPDIAGRIQYVRGDARELPSELRHGGFDSAACVLAIQNIHPIAPVFEGVCAALKPGGRFVVAMMHPCFRGPKATGWGWDDASGVQYRRVDRYLLPRKSPIVAHPGRKDGAYTWSFHKPIEAYVKSLRGAGLLIDAIEEWKSHKTSTSGPRAAAENVAREEIPMFMAIRAVNVPGIS
jgi:ubiquinone/menaquinone biosynthesis C-methylase UbiE